MEKYHLLDTQKVTVDSGITFDGREIDWKFDFIVNTEMEWKTVYILAKKILTEKFGETGWKISQISLATQE